MVEILLLPRMYLRELVTRPGRQAGRYNYPQTNPEFSLMTQKAEKKEAE